MQLSQLEVDPRATITLFVSPNNKCILITKATIKTGKRRLKFKDVLKPLKNMLKDKSKFEAI